MSSTAGGSSPPFCHDDARNLFVLCAPHSSSLTQRPACLGTCKSLNFKRTRRGTVMHHARPRRRPGVSVNCTLSPRPHGQTNTSTLLAYLNLINDATKWTVSVTAAGTLIWHHDIYVSWCFLGSIVAVFACKTLKKVINIQRPADARKQDPGMPSSHASSLAYLATYLSVAWHSEPPVLACSGLALAATLIPLRVILGYHTIPQVIAGACFGATSAVSWHALGQQVALPVLETSMTSRIWLAAAMILALTSFAVAAFRRK